MSRKGQKIMEQPINVIFQFLQTHSKVQIWLYDKPNLRIEGNLIGFDEFMNLTLDNCEEILMKSNEKRFIGRILLKGDNITLIQKAELD
ncbi:small nuclear ribonucleoprotein e [Anaeramoeba flamelloides]|uniref:Small nuclear ribonucleoprotein E n=1 Tax=Anaeramoeba flamelloides TaxID=1746091 RepID=A0AAV7YTS6_9EUKA|nr:small nuclear ribonucleoprotein e [Anaeramoeba flamelloides]KAJ6228428.1 small nuclear ribonucleoprotein e [Anaeramoeba flamelloides]